MRVGKAPSGAGRQFGKGNPGKPKGAKDRRTIIGRQIEEAIAARAFERLTELMESGSRRIALEASRTVLAYAWGLPKATLEVTGGSAELARELTAALQEVRARRALSASAPPVSVPAVPNSAAPLPALPPPPEPVLEAEIVAPVDREEPTA